MLTSESKKRILFEQYIELGDERGIFVKKR